MGIRGLEKFIRKCGRNIRQEIHIPSEIAKWRREHGKNPTIMVEMTEFLRIIWKYDEGGQILGGRYQPINDIFEYFFGQIKKTGAHLVFFWRLSEGKYVDGSRYMKNNAVFDCIRNHQPLKDHLQNEKRQAWKLPSTLRPCERMWYNLIKLSENYGDVIVNCALDESPILSYARQHRNDVHALITRNTDHLVFDDEFEFWSMSDLRIFDLKLVKFDRPALKRVFGLNGLQMQLLFAISQLEPEEKANICGNCDLLRGCVPYVKRQKCGPNGYDVSQLTGNFTEDQLEDMSDALNKMSRMNSFTGSVHDDIYSVELIEELKKTDGNFNWALQFCKKKLYFAYKLMNESMTTQKDLLFIDFREPNATEFVELVANITLKLCGTVFKDVDFDMRPKSRFVATISSGTIEPIEKDIIYPPSCERNDEQYDDSRWPLFQWVTDLDGDFISSVNSPPVPKHIRIALFALKLLKGQITNDEAEMILLTEQENQNRNDMVGTRNFDSPPPMPSLRYPNYVELAWVQAAHKYTICFELVCHCLEICGLRKQTTLLLFNALKFHENMHVKNGIQPHMDDSSVRLADALQNLLLN